MAQNNPMSDARQAAVLGEAQEARFIEVHFSQNGNEVIQFVTNLKRSFQRCSMLNEGTKILIILTKIPNAHGIQYSSSF